jgi:hypothetical protein
MTPCPTRTNKGFAIFLSASEPLSDNVDARSGVRAVLSEAVRALLRVALGRAHIVSGGHPTITPLLSLSDYGGKAVTVYTPQFFEGIFCNSNL